jgi:hypothetical protein
VFFVRLLAVAHLSSFAVSTSTCAQHVARGRGRAGTLRRGRAECAARWPTLAVEIGHPLPSHHGATPPQNVEAGATRASHWRRHCVKSQSTTSLSPGMIVGRLRLRSCSAAAAWRNRARRSMLFSTGPLALKVLHRERSGGRNRSPLSARGPRRLGGQTSHHRCRSEGTARRRRRLASGANPGTTTLEANSAAWHEGKRLLERTVAERLDFAFETRPPFSGRAFVYFSISTC